MPHLTEIKHQVDRLVDEALKDTGFFLVDSTAKGPVRAPIISVYLDGDQGISIRDCAAVSRDLHGSIENAGICPDGFELNVSSPGLDRSLRLPRQYARHVGRYIRLEVVDAGADKTVEGRLIGAGDDLVRIEAEAGEIAFPMGSIRKAVVKAAW
jgi:ribosome maturation factor RimP